MNFRFALAIAGLALSAGHACAAAALLMEEPFGVFGRVNPTGHAAVYLSHVCAASPTVLRPCEPGQEGVVISRYHRVGGYDWIAIPLIPYLYAVDDPQQVPASADAQQVAALREAYRQAHLREIAFGDWTQLIGAAYDRQIYSFEIETRDEQDARLIEKLNSARNSSHFDLFRRNCADFSREILNTYYPNAAHRSLFADQGITTPKQIAKCLVSYSKHHSNLQFSSFAIAQVPGSVPRSGAIRGVFEAFLKKKYVLPVVVLHPIVASGMAMAYVVMACCDSHRHFASHLERESQPASILAELQSNRVEVPTSRQTLP